MKRVWRRSLTMAALLVLTMAFVPAAIAQDDDEPTLQQGQQLVQAGRFGEAAEVLQQVVKADPENGPAVFFLGYALHMDGQVEKALKVHQQAAKFERFEGIATYNVACAHALLGAGDKAFEALMKSADSGFGDLGQIEGDSDLDSLRADARFAYYLARVAGDEELEKNLREAQEMLNEGKLDEAAEIYASVTESHEDHGFAWFRLGYALHGAGDLDEAIKMHKKAATYKPFAGIATYNLGCAYSLKKETDQALEALTKAVELGFIRPDAYEEDPDLDNIREDERFVALLNKTRELADKAKERSDKGDIDTK